MDHEEGTVRGRYADVLSRLGPENPGPLSANESLDAEIERVAGELTEYLDGQREWLQAKGLLDAVTTTEIRSAMVEDLEAHSADRAKKAKDTLKTLEQKHKQEIARLQFLLRMRHELKPSS